MPRTKRTELAFLTAVTDDKHMKPDSAKRATIPARRFSVATKPTVHREVVIAKGRGKRLGDIPFVAGLLDKRKARDPSIVGLHLVCFGTRANHLKSKGNLRDFSGVVYNASFDRHKLTARLGKRSINQLRDICELVGLERGGNRDDLELRLADFLEKPRETDAKAPSSPKKRRSSSPTKKRKTRSKKSDDDVPRKKRAKKDKSGPKRAMSAYMWFAKTNRGALAKKHPSDSVTEIAKRLGEMWRKLKDRTEYEAMAAKDKKRYEKECK